MAIKKSDRQKVYDKYGGRCAYCGKKIELKDMQVDHIVPKRAWYTGMTDDQIECIDNFNPACRRCNHYKRAESLDTFRERIVTIQNRLRNEYLFKVAEDYGVVEVKPYDGVFYFEKIGSEGE